MAGGSFGGVPATPMASGRYYTGTGVGGSSALTVNRLYLLPLRLPSGLVARIAGEVNSAVPGASVRLGLYGTTLGMPGRLLVEGGSIDGNTVAAQEVTVSQRVAAGWYWLAAVSQGASADMQILAGISGLVGKPSLAVGNNQVGYYQDGVSGALPSLAVVAGIDIAPRLSVRMA